MTEPTVREDIAAIRAHLNNHYEGLPTPNLYIFYFEQVEHLLTEMGLSGQNWIVGRQTITTNANQDEYDLPSDCVAIALLETHDSSGAQDFRRREVDLIPLKDFNLYWSGYPSGNTGEKHDAICATQYKLQFEAIRKLKIAPPPSQSAEYRIWYQIGRTPPRKLSEKSGVLENFHNYLRIKTAMIAVKNCKNMPDAEYIRIRDQLAWAWRDLKTTFDQFVVQSFEEDNGPRRMYGMDHDYDFFD